MFNRQIYSVLILAVAISIGGSGCVTNKKKQAAAETAPPAAAYPTGEAPPAGGGAAVPPPHNYGGSNAASSPSKPQPFKLREGEQLVVYQIGSGDTLGAIAKKYRTTPSRIKSANGMTSDRIFAGKTIQIPTIPAGGISSSAAPVPAHALAPIPVSTPAYASIPAQAPVLKPLPYGGTTTSSAATAATPAIPSYSGSASSSGLPSVSSSASARKTTPIPPVSPIPAPKSKPVTSGSAFPTPSISSGN